jgi:hypothetical protein
VTGSGTPTNAANGEAFLGRLEHPRTASQQSDFRNLITSAGRLRRAGTDFQRFDDLLPSRDRRLSEALEYVPSRFWLLRPDRPDAKSCDPN